MSFARSNGSNGSTDSFEIEINEALREFAAPISSAMISPGDDQNREDTSVPPNMYDGGKAEQADGERSADEALTRESSDSDVVHIDLTQRPPPLPMSGLALEQLVIMLPGSTYAVSGSGMPMRMSPRAELNTSPRVQPRQQSPSGKADPARPSPETGAACAGENGVEAPQASDAVGEQTPVAHSNIGQAASSSPISPHVTLTFVPGLGLVPIVIHDEMDGEDDDQCSDAYGAGRDSLDEEVAGTMFGRAASDDANSNGETWEVETSILGQSPRETARVDILSDEQIEDTEEAAISDTLLPWRSKADGVAEVCPNAGAQTAPGNYTASDGLGGDAIQQVGYFTMADEGNEDFSDLQRSTSVDSQASSIALDRPLIQQQGELEENVPVDTEVRGLPISATSFTCIPPVENLEHDQESDEYDDDPITVGDGSLDEVDDSGSGGGDEPESILGGLGHVRRAFVPDCVFLSSTSVPVGQYTSSIVEASGIHVIGAGSAGASKDPLPASSLFDSRTKGRLTDSSGIAGIQLPRPRYLAQNSSRACNAAHDTHGDESPPYEGDREAAAVNLGIAMETENAHLPVMQPTAAPLRFVCNESNAGNSDDATSISTAVTAASGSSAPSSTSTGSDLNSTFRGTGQSLAAVRQAALQAEGQRQAKMMAERLGGGAAHMANLQHSSGGSNRPERRIGITSSTGIYNPFGSAEQEASAAAGMIDLGVGNHHRAVRRGGCSNSSTGYARIDNRAVATMDGNKTDGSWNVDLEDLLRDGPIIQPRYPTDTKDRHHDRTEARISGGKDMHDLSSAMEADDTGSWRPRHRRSVDIVDLDMLANDEDDSLRIRSGATRSRSADGSAPPTPASPRSLLGTRKSDDGQLLAPPLASSSPRLGAEDNGSESSSAQSVADERLVDELEVMREELSQKTTLVAGLRGELRKYTELAMRLEHQLNELRAQGGDTSSAAMTRSRYYRSQSEAGALRNTVSAAPSTAALTLNDEPKPMEEPSQQHGVATAVGTASVATSASVARPHGTSAGGALDGNVVHTLPPHPQAQGLEGVARLALYDEILTKAHAQVSRSGGPAPPDLRDAQDLLKGKEMLDAGAEKVMLMKLQKMVIWGCDAAWKASVAQQQVKFMERTARKSTQACLACEAECKQLRQALVDARAAPVQTAPSTAQGSVEQDVGKMNAASAEDELRRQLQAAQNEAATTRDQAADLESAVASLNADVRKLRSQLRSSRDGMQEDVGSAAATAEQVSRADTKAWAMERKLLLTTITSLRKELEQARTTCPVDLAAVDRLHEGYPPAAGAPESSPSCEPAPEKLELSEANLSRRTQELQMESDMALQERASLSLQLEHTHALGADDSYFDAGTVLTSSAGGTGGAGSHRSQVEQLQRELLAARDALEKRTVDAEVAMALHEEQSAALRTQVVELRQELALTTADLASAAGWHENDRRALEMEQAAVAQKDGLINELQQQLLTFEMERNELKVAYNKEVGEKGVLEEKLRQAREALASALLTAENANAAVEQLAAAAGDSLGPEQEAILPVIDMEEALRAKENECERLQELVEARTRDLMHIKVQLEEGRAAALTMKADAIQAKQQVAELQTHMEAMLQAREVAEAELEEAIMNTEALKASVLDMEDKVEKALMDASLWRGRAEQAEAAAAKAREDASELRAYAAGLQAEARDLRTALSAEDNLQAQLRGQVECLESELEAQASLAQKCGEQAAKMEAALAEAEHDRHDTATKAADRAMAVSAELLAAQRAAASAQQRVLELEARLEEVRAKAICQFDASSANHGVELERHHVDAGGQHARTADLEPRGVLQTANELNQWQHEQDSQGRDYCLPSDVALDNRLRAAELARDALHEEVSELRQQLEGFAAGDLRDEHELMPKSDEQIAEQVAALCTERTRLQADCMALQMELEQVRSGQLVRKDAEAQIEALRTQLQATRSDLQAARADLQAANVELSVKGELMAAKDRSLATLQETVDALKLALQVTQQNYTSSPRRVATESSGDGGRSGDSDIIKYQGTVVALQSKFADSESTIRRLERQVAALETRLSGDDGLLLTPTISHVSYADGWRSSWLQAPTFHTMDTANREQQVKEKDEQELEFMRSPIATAASDCGHAVDSSSSPHAQAGGSSAKSAIAATVSSLQVQVEQWRNVCENLHARYQSKKEAVRRLREQLSLVQKRRFDGQAQGQVQLEAASQRLVRLATDLGLALRRCIALDLQPLSATALTTSPRTTSGGEALPDDISTLAAFLAKQGAALVESLEAALDQVNTAREERAHLTIQLANRQAVLDELRHHLSHQAISALGKGEAEVAEVDPDRTSKAGPRSCQASLRPPGLPSTSRYADAQQVAPSAVAAVGGLSGSAIGSNLLSAGVIGPTTVDTSPPPALGRLPSSRALHTAAVNLAQDMAALSAQQAGLRSTLQGFEQRLAQQPSRSRSMSAAAYPPGAVTAYQLSSTFSYPAVSPLRSRASSLAADGVSALAAAVPDGSPPHAYVGIISGSRAEPRAQLGAGSMGGGLHSGVRKTFGVIGQTSLSGGGPLAPSPEGSRVMEALNRDSVGVAFRSPSRLHFLGSPTTSAGSTDAVQGVFGFSSGAASGSGLLLSHERRLKLGDGGI